VVAIDSRELAFGDAVLSPALAAGHRTDDRLGLISIATRDPHAVAKRLGATWHVSNSAHPRSTDDANRETQRWLNDLLVAVIFAFTSLAVLNTLATIALQRRRELRLLRLAGATRRQIAAMTRWEAVVIIGIGIGLGVAIS